MRKCVAELEKTAAGRDAMTSETFGNLSTLSQPTRQRVGDELNSKNLSIESSLRLRLNRWLQRLNLLMVAAVLVMMLSGVKSFAVVAGALVSLLWSLAKVVILMAAEEMQRQKATLLSPPGSWALKALSFVFSRRTFDNVFAQAIADMRDEHAEALAEGRLRKARWIVLAYHFDLVLTLATWFGTSVLQKVVGLWKIGF